MFPKKILSERARTIEILLKRAKSVA